MVRTFTRVELVEHTHELDQRFAAAMGERGFVRTVKGRTTHQALRLPDGMYLIERKTAAQALGLAREASRAANVEARIFCIAAGAGTVRFGNLAVADEPANSHA
jgi:limonene-1,2-epoxide hydrolase